MTRDGRPTLHVACAAAPARGGVPAGELLFSAIAHAATQADRTLLFGNTQDRDTAGALGVRNVWLARNAAGFAAERLLAATIRRAAQTLASQTAGPVRVMLWSSELDRAAPRLPATHEIVRPALDREPPDGPLPDGLVDALMARLPSRVEARRTLGLDDHEPALVPLVASPAHADARAIAFVSGVSDLLALHHTLVLPAQSKRLREACRFIRRTGLGTRVLITQPPHLAALPAADVLITPEDIGTGPVSALLHTLADRLGLPVVTTAGWDTAPGLGHGMLPPEIKATVGPAVGALQRLRAAGA